MSSYNQQPPAYNNPPPQPQAGHPVAQQQGPAVVVVPVTTMGYVSNGPTTYRNYKGQQSIGLGITMIVVGVLMIIFNIVAIVYDNGYYVQYYNSHHSQNYYYARGSGSSAAGYGFWGGVWFLITGPFGIYGGKAKTKCPIVTFMVLSIITAVVMIGTFTASVVAACNNSPDCNNSYGINSEVALAMNSMIAILAGIGAIAAIWGSALACQVACCCSAPGQVISSGPVQYAPGTVISQAGQQPQQQYSGYPGSYVGQGYPPPPMPPQQPIVYPGAPYYQQQPQNNPYPTKENSGYDQEIISG